MNSFNPQGMVEFYYILFLFYFVVLSTSIMVFREPSKDSDSLVKNCCSNLLITVFCQFQGGTMIEVIYNLFRINLGI